VVACLAMDLPKSMKNDGLRDARSKLLSQVRELTPADVVRGQVQGYTDEEGVDKGSKTETFAALRFHIDNERWKGVPFFVRVGKSLPVTISEALVRFKGPECPVLDDKSNAPANALRLRLGPSPVIALGANVKKNGEEFVGERRELILSRNDPGEMKAYERLLGDAIDGKAELYARQDAIEEAWRVIDPILGDATPIQSYDEGSWGPKEQETIAPPGGWGNPV
jgi:glucose-6-phosphate 1-dehydrogenase